MFLEGKNNVGGIKLKTDFFPTNIGKEPLSKYLDFAGRTFPITCKVCCCNKKTAIDKMWMNGCGYVPIKLTKIGMGWVWSMDCALPFPILKLY